MGIVLCVDKLDIDAYLIADFLDTTFQHVRNAELLCDIGQIARFTLVLSCGRAGDDFQIGDFSEARQDFILDTRCEVGVRLVITETFKRQDSNRFVRGSKDRCSGTIQCRVTAHEKQSD